MGLLSYIPLLNLHIRKKKKRKWNYPCFQSSHAPSRFWSHTVCKNRILHTATDKNMDSGKAWKQGYVKQAGSLFSFSCCFAQLVDYGWFVYKNLLQLVRAIYRSWLALFIILPLHGFKISSMCTQRRHPLQCKQQVCFSVHAMAMLMLRAGLSS